MNHDNSVVSCRLDDWVRFPAGIGMFCYLHAQTNRVVWTVSELLSWEYSQCSYMMPSTFIAWRV